MQSGKTRARKFPEKTLAPLNPLGMPVVLTENGIIITADKTSQKLVKVMYNEPYIFEAKIEVER